MNIIILDDYQDAVRKLKCASKLDGVNAKVFTNTVKGIGQLSVRLRDAEALVLIRERTHFPRALLEKLPKLKLICQTGHIGEHIDIDACTQLGIAVAEGRGSPVAPAELTWALLMAAMRRIPQYVGNLKHGAWQQSGLKSASMPANFGIGMVLKGKWRYLEHDWIATEGSYVFEPPGETHTLYVPEDVEEMITYFQVNGVMYYVDPYGKGVGYEDVFTKLDMCRKHYADVGLGADFVDQFVR